MKHLYRLLIEHVGPKDLVTAIVGYVIADNEEQLYDYVISAEASNDFSIFVGWEEDDKEKILKLKGDIHDDDREYNDAFYGISYYGWDDLGEIPDSVVSVLSLYLREDIVII